MTRLRSVKRVPLRRSRSPGAGGDTLGSMIRRLPRGLRDVTLDDIEKARPVYAVWELTMKCDQPCQHCGSRAGPARVSELDTAEILAVARGLAGLGCRQVALSGGGAYLRP